MTAGQIASFAPDYVKAKVSAGRILDLFDRVPEIDSYSTKGQKVINAYTFDGRIISSIVDSIGRFFVYILP